MGPFFDLHCHMLCGVDDGAKNQEMMFSMLEMSSADGTRALCLTPHFSPYLFGDTREKSERVFQALRQYAAQRHPDMQLFLGHELGYHSGCGNALSAGACRTVAGSRYVLVDFPERVDFFELSTGMNQLRGMGWSPILAHAERYRCLASKMAWVEDFVSDGGLIQINASSANGDWGPHAKKMWKKLIKRGFVHLVSSDGHNLTSRQPKISVCMGLLQKYCTPETIEDLVWNNAWRVVRDRRV